MAQKQKPEHVVLRSHLLLWFAMRLQHLLVLGASCPWKATGASLREAAPRAEQGKGKQQGKAVAITGQIATNIYVKHMEVRTNSRDEKANIEQGPALRLNKQWEMRSLLKRDEQREYEKCWELNQQANPGSATQCARAHHPARNNAGAQCRGHPRCPFLQLRMFNSPAMHSSSLART